MSPAMNDKSQYISELAGLFLCSYDGHIDTGAFMTTLCEILGDEKNQGKYPYFDLFVCTKKEGNLTLKYHRTADKCQILHYLFDLCGCQGYEVHRLRDSGKQWFCSTPHFFYEIWISREIQ